MLNQKYVVTGAPSGYKYALTGPATDYEDNQIIEIINMSSSTHAVTLTGGGSFFHTNGGVGTTGADISIGPGQRALIMPDTGANLHYITILTA